MNATNESMGYIEVSSMVAAIEAADAMLKAAYIRLHTSQKAGGGLVCVTVHGDLASCQAAISAGRFAALKHDALIAARVIARPAKDSFELWEEHIPAMRERKRERTGKNAMPEPPVEIVNAEKGNNDMAVRKSKSKTGGKPDKQA